MGANEPRWWAVRPAHSRQPKTYLCPFCGQRLHAMSAHAVIAPEGDVEHRRHAHLECVRKARAAGTFKTYDDWRAEQPRQPGRIARLFGRR